MVPHFSRKTLAERIGNTRSGLQLGNSSIQKRKAARHLYRVERERRNNQLKCLNNKRCWKCYAWTCCNDDGNWYLRPLSNQQCSGVSHWHDDTFQDQSAKWTNYLRLSKFDETREKIKNWPKRRRGTKQVGLSSWKDNENFIFWSCFFLLLYPLVT